MKITPIHWIALFLALALTVAVCDGLRIRDKASVLAGQYQEALAIAKKDGEELTLQIAKMNTIVGQQNTIIAEKNEAIAVVYTDISDRDKQITELSKNLHELEVAGAESPPQIANLTAQIVNLKAQVKAWSEKFTLAEAIILEKDNIIASWAAKFSAQVTISEAWKAKYESEKHLRLLADEGWKVTARQLQRTRIVSNIEKGVIVVFGGIMLYRTIKGK